MNWTICALTLAREAEFEPEHFQFVETAVRNIGGDIVFEGDVRIALEVWQERDNKAQEMRTER